MQESYMLKALTQAQKSFDANEVPVGAVIIDTKTKKLIASANNCMESLNDPTAHAEINAIRQACKTKGSWRLSECDLYVTLEPCPMCAQAISFSRIRRLYFGAYDTKGGGVDHGAKIFQASSCHHKPQIYGGIKEQESMELLKNFFTKKR